MVFSRGSSDRPVDIVIISLQKIEVPVGKLIQGLKLDGSVGIGSQLLYVTDILELR